MTSEAQAYKDKLSNRPSDPDIVQLNLIGEKLANDMSLFDLSAEQNVYFSAVLSLHRNGYYMPFTIQFIRNYLAFSQSRDRLGRQELVGVIHGAIEYARSRFQQVSFTGGYEQGNLVPSESTSPGAMKYIGYLLLIVGAIWVLMFYGGG